jgi:hypothetical protein
VVLKYIITYALQTQQKLTEITAFL